MRANANVLITYTDAKRLEKLLASLNDKEFPGKPELESELDRAQMIDSKEVPETVVTMNSVVRFRLEPSNKEFCLKLVYPDQKKSEEANISILAPVGSALLGLSVGDVIYWSKPGGGKLRVKIVGLDYQPEREGLYHI